jgi:hypothetical protein
VSCSQLLLKVDVELSKVQPWKRTFHSDIEMFVGQKLARLDLS